MTPTHPHLRLADPVAYISDLIAYPALSSRNLFQCLDAILLWPSLAYVCIRLASPQGQPLTPPCQALTPLVIALIFVIVFHHSCTSSFRAALSPFLSLFLHTCRHPIYLFLGMRFPSPTVLYVTFSLVDWSFSLPFLSLSNHFANGWLVRTGVFPHFVWFPIKCPCDR